MRFSASETSVGILANPLSGRDVRRLVAQASVFQLSEKCNLITRLLSGLGATGIGRVVIMPDVNGLGERVRRAIDARPAGAPPWPQVSFLDMPVADGPEDTLCAVELMVQAGVEVIVVLGGDGTHRLVAMVCGATPVMALSTGTNNVFPKAHEATVAGIATGLVAGGLVSRTEVVRSNKVLHVDVNGVRRGLAVVDVSVSCERWIGAKALWRPEALRHIFIAFSEPGAVGLSSIAGLLRPISREAGLGLRVDLMPLAQAATVLMAPLAPGLIVPVGIGTVREIQPGATEIVQTPRGVIALDGERELEFMDTDRISVRLDRNGPFTIDLDRVMARAAQDGLLARSAIEVTRRT